MTLWSGVCVRAQSWQCVSGSEGHGSNGSTNMDGSRMSCISTSDLLTHDASTSDHVNQISRRIPNRGWRRFTRHKPHTSRPGAENRFCPWWPWPLTFGLDILTHPSEGTITSSVWIWRKSVQGFQRYFIQKQKITDDAKNSYLRSSLRAVITFGIIRIKMWLFTVISFATFTSVDRTLLEGLTSCYQAKLNFIITEISRQNVIFYGDQRRHKWRCLVR